MADSGPVLSSGKLGSSEESRSAVQSRVICARPRLMVEVRTPSGGPIKGAKVTLGVDEIPVRGPGDADFGERDPGPKRVTVRIAFAGTPYTKEDEFTLLEDLVRRVVVDIGVVHLFLDSDRNGTLTRDGLEKWDRTKGAIVMCNCNASGGLVASGIPVADNADEEINGAEDAADIAPLEIRRAGPAGTCRALLGLVDERDGERIRIFNSRTAGARSVLGGRTRRARWEVDLSREVLALGMEALRFDKHSDRDDIRIFLAVSDVTGNEYVEMGVVRVAPWIMRHQLARPLRVFAAHWEASVRLGQDTRTVTNAGFRRDLGEILRRIDVPLDTDTLNFGNDRWAQDCAEFGFTCLPGRALPVVLRAPRTELGLASCVPKLRSRDMGCIAVGTDAERDLDKFGNLEVTPPLPGYRLGRIYYGSREGETLNPEVLQLIYGQVVQAPLEIDTSFLDVGHVDEIMAFVGTEDNWRLCLSNVGLAYDLIELVARADPEAKIVSGRHMSMGESDNFREPIETLAAMVVMDKDGVQSAVSHAVLARRAKGVSSIDQAFESDLRKLRLPNGEPEGPEAVPAELRPEQVSAIGEREKRYRAEIEKINSKEWFEEQCRGEVASVREQSSKLRDLNFGIIKSLNATLERLKREIGLSDERMIPIPTLYCVGTKNVKRARALTGNMVNMLVLGRDCIMSAPYGPTVRASALLVALATPDRLKPNLRRLAIEYLGLTTEYLTGLADAPIDLFRRAVEVPLRACGLTPHFIDNYDAYHAAGGDVHCGTNTVRETPAVEWWNVELRKLAIPAPRASIARGPHDMLRVAASPTSADPRREVMPSRGLAISTGRPPLSRLPGAQGALGHRGPAPHAPIPGRAPVSRTADRSPVAPSKPPAKPAPTLSESPKPGGSEPKKDEATEGNQDD